MTDKDKTMKALRCCASGMNCRDCPLRESTYCAEQTALATLIIITQQAARIAELEGERDAYKRAKD